MRSRAVSKENESNTSGFDGPGFQDPLIDPLMAVTPIDGRYHARTRALAAYFSEFALIRYRVRVEIEWLLALAENPALKEFTLDRGALPRLRALYADFTLADARRVKELERTTNHDVKAIEYFLAEKIAATGIKVPPGMIHFACTSEDINNLAYALMLKEFCERELAPALDSIVATLAAMARRWRSVAMVARTHGQPATPTTMGKELAVFAARLERQRRALGRQEFLGKFNGAVGNFNAHQAAVPEADWIECSRRFVESMGLVWNPLTTQIESHDFIAELLDLMVRIDTILLGFARDMWGYIALGYFGQRTVKGEVGSSVMPHKVNPIDFENCEGNLGLATALFQHLAAKLPVSRWQRDLERQHGDARVGHRVRPSDGRARGAWARARSRRAQRRADCRRPGGRGRLGSAGRGGADGDAPPGARRSLRAAEGTDPRTRDRPRGDARIHRGARVAARGQGAA